MIRQVSGEPLSFCLKAYQTRKGNDNNLSTNQRVDWNPPTVTSIFIDTFLNGSDFQVAFPSFWREHCMHSLKGCNAREIFGNDWAIGVVFFVAVASYLTLPSSTGQK